MRIPTALLVLVSLVATPLASTACMARCEFFVMHQHLPCGEKTHEHIGRHVDHMNHVHTVNQSTEQAVAAHYEQARHLVASWNCPNGSCATMKPAVPRSATIRASELHASSYVPTMMHGSSPASSENLSNIAGFLLDTSPAGISAPLRI